MSLESADQGKFYTLRSHRFQDIQMGKNVSLVFEQFTNIELICTNLSGCSMIDLIYSCENYCYSPLTTIERH